MESYKIEVRFRVDDDGLLRVWSPDVPGFRLAHKDQDAVLNDIVPALETILEDRWGRPVTVRLLRPISERDSNMSLPTVLPSREYVSEIRG